MFTASNIHYEIAERTRGVCAGGIGAVHQMACKIGLVDAIDRHLHLLKVHLPYHESDHVLNIQNHEAKTTRYQPATNGRPLEVRAASRTKYQLEMR